MNVWHLRQRFEKVEPEKAAFVFSSVRHEGNTPSVYPQFYALILSNVAVSESEVGTLPAAAA